jgi:hypothetical protein
MPARSDVLERRKPCGAGALGYVESVEGSLTGTVIDAGWRDDPGLRSATVAA